MAILGHHNLLGHLNSMMWMRSLGVQMGSLCLLLQLFAIFVLVHQNSILIYPCAGGLRSNSKYMFYMLPSRIVRAISFTPELPVQKVQPKIVMCVRSGWETRMNHTDSSLMSLELALWIHTSERYRRPTKQESLHDAHVRAGRSEPHSKREKRLLDAIKPRLLSCYSPGKSSNPQIPKQ